MWNALRSTVRDARNFVQAQVAVRTDAVYLPSLFGHYSVNSACNLRCSYCYVHEPETYATGFKERGLPLAQAKKVVYELRQEAFSLRLQGGEPLIYPHIIDLAHHARRELRFRSVSIITNGLGFARRLDHFRPLLEDLDVITISLDGTRLREYPDEMEELIAFLPTFRKLCDRHRITLTSNYTATWDELAEPARIEDVIARYQDSIPFFYVMPVRKVGKTPLPLLRNSQRLMRKYSLGYYGGPEYPETENVDWYRQHCKPKLKIKVMANGDLLAPCENFASSVGSLLTHSIRDLWKGELTAYPNHACLGCGKQRFRLKAFTGVGSSLKFAWKLRRDTLDWSSARQRLHPTPAPPPAPADGKIHLPVVDDGR